MSYITSVIYKNEDKTYIGVLNDGLNEIISFKPLFYYKNINLKPNVMYVIMMDDNRVVYELDKVSFDNLFEEESKIEDFKPEELTMIGNRIFQRYITNKKVH